MDRPIIVSRRHLAEALPEIGGHTPRANYEQAKVVTSVKGGQHMQEFTIAQAASELGVSHRTLRFYEQKGLVRPKRDGNRRLYSGADVARLRQIREWVGLGFTLEQVHELLRLRDEGREDDFSSALHTAAYDRLSQARQERAALDEQVTQLEVILRARKAA